MGHIIIGTAGHVDHGKTMLIKSLTGKDTDRLREEKERGISIDLGFAPFKLPSGRVAGVVDVPGHERFIHNMLAGVGGMDLVLLVVDSTEGVMPQTKEHLAILELLQVRRGIIVLTKLDLVEREWLELVEEEVRESLRGTFLEKAPLYSVSVVSGEGVEELKRAIDRLVVEVEPRDHDAPIRLPIDRVFSVSGFGTVITGTLLTGKISEGQIVEVLPPGVETRVRQLQVHDQEVKKAEAGQRVAVNLAGLEKERLERGSVVIDPGYFELTSLCNARLYLLPKIPHSLENLKPVHFYLGTSRVVARVILLDREVLCSGESTVVQLRLERPIVARRGDPFIIRSYSPMTTIGGGVILDHQARRLKRFRPETQELIRCLDEGGLEEYIRLKVDEREGNTFGGLDKLVGLGKERLKFLVDEMAEKGELVYLDEFYLTQKLAEGWFSKVVRALDGFHNNNPLLPGMSRAQLRGVLPAHLTARGYEALLNQLAQQGKIEFHEDLISRAGFTVQPTPVQKKDLCRMLKFYRQKNFAPPSPQEVQQELGFKGEQLSAYLVYLAYNGDLIKVGDGVFFQHECFKNAIEILHEHFREHSALTLAQYRDLLGTSRRFAQILLEYFDQEKLTRRVGDKRVPFKLNIN